MKPKKSVWKKNRKHQYIIWTFLPRGKIVNSELKCCFQQRTLFYSLNIPNFCGQIVINQWFIEFEEPKNKLSIWNNNTAGLYKALPLLAERRICWFRTGSCSPYDPRHSFPPPFPVPGYLLYSWQKCFRERMNDISSESSPESLPLGIGKQCATLRCSLIPCRKFLHKLRKEEHISSCFRKMFRILTSWPHHEEL